MKRRDFLKSTGVGVVALGGIVCSFVADAAQSPNKLDRGQQSATPQEMSVEIRP